MNNVSNTKFRPHLAILDDITDDNSNMSDTQIKEMLANPFTTVIHPTNYKTPCMGTPYNSVDPLLN